MIGILFAVGPGSPISALTSVDVPLPGGPAAGTDPELVAAQPMLDAQQRLSRLPHC